MTREKEINIAASKYIEDNSMSDGEVVISDHKDSFIEGAEWADAHPKSPWISTDKYLPKQGGHYLCNDGNNHISMLAFCGDKWVNSRTFDDIPLEAVKYWMPIPKLPKE